MITIEQPMRYVEQDITYPSYDYDSYMDLITGGRASGWAKFAHEWLLEFPTCWACGGIVLCVPHHIIPFHVDPSHELDRKNLMTLCGAHHIWIGHLGDFRSWNVDALKDASTMLVKIKSRPYLKAMGLAL